MTAMRATLRLSSPPGRPPPAHLVERTLGRGVRQPDLSTAAHTTRVARSSARTAASASPYRRHVGDNLDAAWTSAKADMRSHQASILRSERT